MSRARKPLVLSDTASVQQLQAPDDIDAPAAERLDWLTKQVKCLAKLLHGQGIEVPDELLED